MINFILFILLFIFLINLKTVYFSFPIFYLLAPIGLILFLIDIIKNRYKVENNYIIFFGLVVTGFALSFLSILINQSGDIFFSRQVYFFSLICFFYLYFFVKFFIKNDGDLNRLVIFFLLSVSVQLLVSFLLYLNSNLFSVFFTFFDTAIGFVSKETVESFNEQRMIAIGNPFFGSAILNCFSLVLLAIYFRYTNNKNLFILLWLIISVLGMASARTTIIGILLSMLILILNLRISFKYLFFSLLLMFISVNFLYFTNERIHNIIEFSFGFLFDFDNSQASESTSDLFYMFKILPDNIFSWVFGDGFFLDNQGYYYKGIDVGYTRIIFANGLIGLAFFVIFQIFIFVKSSLYIKKDYFPLFFIVLIFLLNFKGLVNFGSYFLLFFIFSTMFNVSKGLRR